MTRVTFERSRVRESRMLGSVRAKPDGLATRPEPRRTRMVRATEFNAALADLLLSSSGARAFGLRFPRREARELARIASVPSI